MIRSALASLCIAALAALAACNLDSGLQGAASLKVAPILDSVYVGDQLPPHQITYFDASGNPQPSGPVVWGSTDTSIARIDSTTGGLIGRKRGSVVITARAKGVTGAALVIVSDTLDITLLLDTIYLMPSDTLTVPVVVLKRNVPPAPVVSYEAPSNPAYSIDASGKITAVAAGGPFPYIVHADAFADTGAVYVLSLGDTTGGKFFFSVRGTAISHAGGSARALNYQRSNGKLAFQLRGTFVSSSGITSQIVQITLPDSVIGSDTTFAIDSLNPSEDSPTFSQPAVVCTPPRPWALWNARIAGITAYSRRGGELGVTQIVAISHGQAMSGRFTFLAQRADMYNDPLGVLSIYGSFVTPLVTNRTICR